MMVKGGNVGGERHREGSTGTYAWEGPKHEYEYQPACRGPALGYVLIDDPLPYAVPHPL